MRSAIGLWLVTLLCVFSSLSSGEEVAKDERLAVHGKVVGADGEPVPGIAVRGTTYDDITEATSDAEGKFVLNVLEARRTQLQIVAVDPEGERLGLVRGYSRESQQSEPVVKLSPCKSLAFEVTDAEGNPAAGVSIGSIADYSRVLDVVTGPDGKATLRVPEWRDIHSLFAYSPELGFDYKVVTTPRDKTWRAKWLEDKPIRMQLARNQTVKLQLTEATDEPIADIKVSLWLLYKPGEPDTFNLGSLPEAFRATTDKSGVATFSVPDWNVHPLTFWPDSSDLTYVRQRMTFDPAKHPDNVVQVVLDRLVPISGQVKVRDGEPRANVAVSIVGAGYEDNFQEQVKTDSEGRYRMMVPPHVLYAIGVESREWGAPLVDGVIVKPNEPLKNLDLELRPATRIHGQLTMGPGKEPVTGERVVLNQGARDLHNTPGLELPNPENSRRWVEPNFFRQGMTDKLGHFEFFVGPGKYTLSGPSQVAPYKFEVVDEREVRHDFNAPRPERGPFAGMVVTGDPPRPVPDALVDGIYRAHVDPEFRARTDGEGKFADERALHRVVLRVKSDDGKLAGIIEIGPDETDVTIPIAPVGSATARLVDATSGDALPATEIWWGRRVHIGDDDAPWQTAWGGYVTTDDEGRFTLEGLVVGQEYDLSVPRGDGSYGSLPEFVCESAECVDLGDMKLAPPYVPPTFEERVAEQLAATRSPGERYDRALEEAVRLRQHVAVVFLQPGEPVTDSWFRLRLEDREVRNALPDYQLIQLDSKNEQAQELAERLELSLDASAPQWVITTAAGEVLATGAVPLEADGSKIDRAALLERLAHHAPEPLDAHEVLKTALADAAATNRRVIVQETATWCGPCHMLARFLEKHRGMWEKDYVWIRIDHRWKGSQEVMDSLEAEDRGGIPWCAILDAEGKVLATSNGPDGNIGFPSEPKGIEHFASMLNTTRQRMTERDVDELCNELKGE